MIRFLALLLGWWVYKPYSRLVSSILRSKGIKVGLNFYIQGVPYLKLKGCAQNIEIGNGVRVLGDIDLRNRENGKIKIEDNVTFDTGCRLVAANESTLLFKQGADIGGYCIFNCGTNVSIGKDTMLAGFCYVQSSNHGTAKDQTIKSQGHTYGEINIGDDCWLASRVTVIAGVKIGNGAIVGANAVVTKNLENYSINVGIPAKKIGSRT